MKRHREGSITVFLSLTLLLVLSIIMTTVEAARVNTASALSLRALMTALDSVMTEYDRLLFDTYHIYALDGGYGESEISSNTICNKLNKYMTYTFEPEKDLDKDNISETYLKLYQNQSDISDISLENGIDFNYSSNYPNLYDVQIESTSTNEMITLLDYNGELFEKQALEYMKYKTPADMIRSFFDKASMLKTSEDSIRLLEEKEKVEKEAQKIDEVILKLMEKLDGITITKKGIKMKSNGVVVKSTFLKKLSIGTPSMSSMGINNVWLFQQLYPNYRNINSEITILLQQADSIYELNQRIENINEKISSLSQVDTSDMEEDERVAHNQELEAYQDTRDSLIDKRDNLVKNINSSTKEIKTLFEDLITLNSEAVKLIEQGVNLQEEVRPKIEEYEELVLSSKEKVGEDFYTGLEESVKELSKYKGSNTSNKTDTISNALYDFSSMKQILKSNELVLQNSLDYLSTSISSSNESVHVYKININHFLNNIKQYNTKNLKFDYSTLTEPQDSESFIEGISKLMKNGILELVVDDYDSLSKKSIVKENMPSSKLEENTGLEKLDGLLDGIDLDNGINILDNLLSENSLKEAIYDFSEKGLSLVLFQEYLKEHFTLYAPEQNSDNKALLYELEYILKGNEKDIDNLSSVVTQILIIRTIFNLITLLSDSTKSGEAKVLAASFVGFTGIPLLVEAVRMVILTLWALVEALVDVAALLMGEKVPVIKTGKDIQINLYEILGISKTLIRQKALNYKDAKISIGLSYKDYIGLFLFFENKEKKLYRTMDLIQENLQLSNENFYIKNCITGLGVSSTFHMEPKFVAVPFIRKILVREASGYQFSFSSEYTY